MRNGLWLTAEQCLWIEGFPLVFSLAFVKIAVLLFYVRIFTLPGFKLAVHIYVAVLSAWCFAMMIVSLSSMSRCA